jgi:hypothetical protein
MVWKRKEHISYWSTLILIYLVQTLLLLAIKKEYRAVRPNFGTFLLVFNSDFCLPVF